MAFGLSAASMSGHGLIRAEQLQTTDQIGGRDAGFRQKRDIVFVVNPRSANGSTGREWKKLLPHVKARLGDRCNICESITTGPSHAVDVTREAIKEGAEAVIAVGGDGTLHEVVNGFFEAGELVAVQKHGLKYSTAFGLIPLGTGSDFARTFGWKNDPCEALDRITKGNKSKIDVGIISREGEEPHFFINVADIHLSAKAGYYASKYKSFGNLCYVFGALQGFVGHRNQDFRIKINEEEWKIMDKVTAVCIGNAKYFGGGMKITPTAHPANGTLEVVILQNFQWYDFLLSLHKLYRGTHLSDGKIFSRSVKSIEVQEVDRTGDIYVQSDGEHLGFLPMNFSIKSGAIEMFV